MQVKNKLSATRKARDLAAADVARQAGVSRQTIYAIEAGSYVPNTMVALRLAQILGVSVEELFVLEPPADAGRTRLQEVEMLPGDMESRAGQPVELCPVDGRLMAVASTPIPWRLPASDAVLVETGDNPTVRVLGEGTRNNRLLVAGCDPGISILVKHLARARIELVAAHRNSSQALDLLRRGLVHVAGSHLRDEASGESNLAAVRKRFPRGSVTVVSVALWEEGLVVAKGNPKQVRGIEDLARKGITMVNREAGAGSRILVDRLLARLGIESRRVRGYERVAPGHLPAAWQVRSGEADCCVATRTAAHVLGLDFIPLSSERYDLIVRKRHLSHPGVQELFNTLNHSAFRRDIEELGGYDAANAGTRVV